MDNRTIAQRLAGHARSLESEAGNLYRIRAYRRAAETVLSLDDPVEAIVLGGQDLKRFPGIGGHISAAIERLVKTGELPPAERH